MVTTYQSVLNSILQKTVHIDREQRTASRKIVTQFVEKLLITTMKEEDKLFKALYQRIQYTGSFYEGLRIVEATEFDLNLILKLPISNNNRYELIDSSSSHPIPELDIAPGFAVCCTNQLMLPSDPRYSEYNELNKFFEQRNIDLTNSKYILLPCKLRYWFESVVNHAITKIRSSHGDWINLGNSGPTIKVSMSKSGPALTFHITRYSDGDGLEIDVDLVPAFNIYGDCDPFIVPKPRHSNERNILWRLSYPKKEKNMVDNQSCAKNVIKLLKRLRDLQGAPFKALKSYYLKTLVLWELHPSPGNIPFKTPIWLDMNLDEKFMSCLEKLQICLKDKKIPFYHNKEHNLLENIKDATIYNMERRLENIKKDIKSNHRSNPEKLEKYFVRTSPQSRYESSNDEFTLPPTPYQNNSSAVQWIKVAGGAFALGLGLYGAYQSYKRNRENILQSERSQKEIRANRLTIMFYVAIMIALCTFREIILYFCG